MKNIAVATFVMTWLACAASAQTALSKAPDGTVPVAQLIASVAKETGRKFIVDPRVRADVSLVGEGTARVSYEELLTILSVYGFTAVDSGGYVRVIPDAVVRQLPLPIISDGSKHADAEFVSAVIPVRTMPAAHLVPILRPLLPQVGHLAAIPCSNNMTIVDTYGNVRRVQALVREIDTGTPYKVDKCVWERSPTSAVDSAIREAISEAVAKEMAKDTSPRDKPPSR